MEYLAAMLQACHDDPNAFNELFIGDGKYFWSRQAANWSTRWYDFAPRCAIPAT